MARYEIGFKKGKTELRHIGKYGCGSKYLRIVS